MERQGDDLRALQREVIGPGYCIGCGACAAANGSIAMRTNRSGFLQADTSHARAMGSAVPVTAVCPFSDDGPDEDAIAAELYPGLAVHGSVGRYEACYAGRVTDEGLFARSSSGGMGRWLLRELLARGLVSHVACVAETAAHDANDPHFTYRVMSDLVEVENASRSAYYPVEMSAILAEIAATPGRFAVTGPPCFLKALRLLMRHSAVHREKIAYTVGLVCGHLKSRTYAELLAWQMGVAPDDLEAIDFRVKIPGKAAKEKGVACKARSSGTTTAPRTVQTLYGTNYGLNVFAYGACEMCDDVLAETADVSVGDAWLPQYSGAGTSLVVVRHPEIAGIIRDGIASGALALDPISAEEAAASQAGGLRQRRDGLSFRLALLDRLGVRHPKKRVAAGSIALRAGYERIFLGRMVMRRLSPIAFRIARAFGSFFVFRLLMRFPHKFYLSGYDRLNRTEKVFEARRPFGTLHGKG